MRIREWLNQEGHHSTAFVFVEFEDEMSCSGTFRIADCNRQVDLSLDAYNLEQAENAIEKLDTLVYAAKEAQKHLRKVRNRYRKSK